VRCESIFGFAHLLGKQLTVQGDQVIEDALVGFDQETGRERIALGRGETPQGTDLVPLRAIG